MRTTMVITISTSDDAITGTARAALIRAENEKVYQYYELFNHVVILPTPEEAGSIVKYAIEALKEICERGVKGLTETEASGREIPVQVVANLK